MGHMRWCASLRQNPKPTDWSTINFFKPWFAGSTRTASLDIVIVNWDISIAISDRMCTLPWDFFHLLLFLLFYLGICMEILAPWRALLRVRPLNRRKKSHKIRTKYLKIPYKSWTRIIFMKIYTENCAITVNLYQKYYYKICIKNIITKSVQKFCVW